MNRLSARVAAVLTALLFAPGLALAADSLGHARITYTVATAPDVMLEDSLAKVMALAAIVPDFVDFRNPAAHCMTKDPLMKDEHSLAMDPAEWQRMLRDSREAAARWREFYLSAAVAAMKEGRRRERAAFLLGYAMHNVQDFACHGGIPKVLHAWYNSIGQSPDSDRGRLASATTQTESALRDFRARIGDENWRLFKGETVRKTGSAGGDNARVPEPVTLFADLKDWDPRSGVIPPASSSVRDKAFRATLLAFLAGVLGKDERPGELEQSTSNKVQNFVCGLYGRQGRMLQILDAVPRPTGSPPAPEHMALATTQDLIFDLLSFQGVCKPNLPERFRELPADQQKMLKELTWETLVP